MRRKKVILIVTPKYPNAFSGASIQNHKINKLLFYNYNFFILTKNNASNNIYDGIKVVRIISIISSINIINKVRWLILASIFLIKNKEKFDLVHVLGADSKEVLLLPIIKLLGKPIILKRATSAEISGKKLKQIKAKIIKYTVNTVISISKEITDELNELGLKKKTVYLPNGVFIKKNVKKSLINIPIFVIIGIIRPRKGLIEAVQFLVNVNPFKNYKCIIAGPVSNSLYWDQVKLLFAKFSINYNYLGPIQNNKIGELLNQATLLISMSKREGLPNIVLEAMSNGVPVICSDIRPHREIIVHNYNGMIYCKDNEKEFHRLKDNDFYKKMSVNANKSISNFDINNTKNSYDKLYARLSAE